MTDTGNWKWHGEIWFVVQRKDGGVVCNSEKGSFTAADAKTWQSWKNSGFWVRCE